MTSEYMDLLVEVGKLYRILTRRLQEFIQEDNKIFPFFNYTELMLLYELRRGEIISPHELAKEGEYMINHLFFNLKNMERNNLLNLEGSTIDLSKIQIKTKGDIGMYDFFFKKLDKKLKKGEIKGLREIYVTFENLYKKFNL